jgi:hypothetical protein
MVTHTGWWLRRRASFLLALSLGLAVLADYLFYDAPVGWTAGLYTAALLLALAMRSLAWLRTWPGRILALGTATLGATMVLDPTPLAVILASLGLITLAMMDRQGWTGSFTRWLLRWAAFAWQIVAGPLRDMAVVRRLRRWSSRPSNNDRWQWLVALAGGAVFVGLFALANPMIEWLLRHAGAWMQDALGDLPRLTPPARVALWLAVMAGAWALLRARAPLPRRRAAAVLPPTATAPPQVALVTRCLVVFNAVFLVQMLMDGVYLIGRVKLPEGMTYAQYAQRGAYPLMATALLAGLFVLIAFRPGGAAQASAWTRRLVLAWIGQNVLLMLAAAWRLNLYMEQYSLSRWRFAAAVWLLLVAIGLMWLLWRIAADRSNAWLVNRVALSALLVLYAVSLVNVDGLIARYNVAHCLENRGQGVPLDIGYLQSLGHESLPALRAFARTELLPGTDLEAQHARCDAAIAALEHQLDRELVDWRGWTARRLAAHRDTAQAGWMD